MSEQNRADISAEEAGLTVLHNYSANIEKQLWRT